MGAMKINKTKTLLLTLALTMSLSTAHAQSFGSIVSGIKDKITNAGGIAVPAKPKALSDDQIVDNSMLSFGGSVAPDVKWLMIIIKKNDFKEQLTVAVNNGFYQTRISLQDGPGIYDIELYSNTNEERYTSYLQFKKFSVENTDSRDMSFLLPTFKVQSTDDRIKDLVANITQNAQNEEEAFLAIYKYVTSTIKYDYVSLNNGKYVTKDYNAVNTLLSSTAVCEGYANLLAAMSRAYGIRAKVVIGLGKTPTGSGLHAWNEVFINDEWKVADSTWDAGRKNQPYLFMNPEKFALDHIKESESLY